jgi:putative colanic acid biosynthesis acetyltransferase WcaF
MHQVELVKRVSLKNKVARSVWNVVYALAFRPWGTKLFNPWRLFLLRCFGAKIPYDSGVYASVRIWAPWNLRMGHNSWLGPNVRCYNQAMVTLGDDVTISQQSHLCAAGHELHHVNSKDNGLIVAPITIESRAWVAADAFIGMGVTVGEGAVVGARAAVFKDVEPWTVVGGNPARFIKKRELQS